MEFKGSKALAECMAAAVEFAEERMSEWQEANPLEVYDDDEEDEWSRRQFEDPENLDTAKHFVWIVGHEDLVRNVELVEEGWDVGGDGWINRVSCADLVKIKRQYGEDLPAIEACAWNVEDKDFDYESYNRRYPYSAELGRRYDAINCSFEPPHTKRHSHLVGHTNPDNDSNMVRLPVIPICHKCGHVDTIGKAHGELCSNCDPNTSIDDLVAAAYPWKHGTRWLLIVDEEQPSGTYDTFQEGCQAILEWSRDLAADHDFNTFE